MGSSEVAQLLTVLVSATAGLVVGSFLNVAVYRLPLGMSVVEPPSHCPSCGARLTLVDLVPVLSWLWLRGRCRRCGAHISWRYPLVELCAGALCAGAAATLGSVWPLPPVAVLLVCALGAATVDIDGGAVPPAFSLVGALAALSLLPIAAVLGHPGRIGWAALGTLLAALVALVASVGKRSGSPRRAVGIVLLACLAWEAGWLWPAGGACVAAWILLAALAVRRGARRQAPLWALTAGSVVWVVASALINRP